MKTLHTGYYAKHGKLPGAISISVRPPRWFPGMPHFAPLAPDERLVVAYKAGRISAELYTQRYLDVLNTGEHTAQQVAALLEDGAVLLCYERPPNFCHRHIAAEWLRANVPGIEIAELP